jgi:hypothetical protein
MILMGRWTSIEVKGQPSSALCTQRTPLQSESYDLAFTVHVAEDDQEAPRRRRDAHELDVAPPRGRGLHEGRALRKPRPHPPTTDAKG